MKPMSTTARTQQCGLTLIELLVAMVIGLTVTLAITSVIVIGEAHKRTTTASNDMGQTSAYAAYVLDRTLRSAGSGFAQSWNLGGVFGCRLSAARSGTVILPRTATAFPVPFADFLGGAGATKSGSLSVAPLLIAKNQSAAGSDVLVVMGGGIAGDVSRPIRTPGTGVPSDGMRLDNTLGLAAGDIELISQSGIADCLIEQVSPSFTNSIGNQILPFNGATYYTATGATTPFSTLRSSGVAYLTALGNLGANSAQFQLIGVGANRTLFGYDLLQSDGTDVPQALADGVAELHAVYGLDTNGDGTLDAWAAPDDTGYDIATLMTTPATLRQIVAARVALVLRSSNYEKGAVAPATLALFSDLTNAAGTSLKQTVDLTSSTDYPHYRYRVVETTIPLRNMLLLP
ncbi:PilW family protein [Polaromonas sp. DSP2-3-2b2]|uniref:PilW family protein n=1 Tax=Polaromonas sp. DSP2-3-2b2 TaxID=2804662 RepID=UPI003CF49670